MATEKGSGAAGPAGVAASHRSTKTNVPATRIEPRDMRNKRIPERVTAIGRFMPLRSLEDELEGEEADHEVDHIGGGQELEPLRGLGQRLAGQDYLRRAHGAQEQRHLGGQEEDGKE